MALQDRIISAAKTSATKAATGAVKSAKSYASRRASEKAQELAGEKVVKAFDTAKGIYQTGTAAARVGSFVVSNIGWIGPVILFSFLLCFIIMIIASVVDMLPNFGGSSETAAEGVVVMAALDGCAGTNYTYDCISKTTCENGTLENIRAEYGDEVADSFNCPEPATASSTSAASNSSTTSATTSTSTSGPN